MNKSIDDFREIIIRCFAKIFEKNIWKKYSKKKFLLRNCSKKYPSKIFSRNILKEYFKKISK